MMVQLRERIVSKEINLGQKRKGRLSKEEWHIVMPP
jgi:hypothetical protein